MAIKTLVNNPSPLVKQMLDYVRQMTEQNKEFALAMLVPSEAFLSDRWNLVLSAPWIDRDGLNAAIPTVTSTLLKYVSRSNAKKLERVSVLPTSDPLVSQMINLGILPGDAYHLQNYPLGSAVGEAIVLVARRPAVAGNSHAQWTQSRA